MFDSLLLCLLVFSTPHIYYYFVWTQSKSFIKLVKTHVGPNADPVQVFSQTSYMIKIFQFTWLFLFMFSLGSFDFDKLSFVRFILAVALFGAGQVLNGAVYKAIGVNGVYYGTRLGKTVPWYTGFPYDSVPHPQYFGSALSMWGVALLLWNGPQHTPVLIVALAVSAFYAFSSWVEAVL